MDDRTRAYLRGRFRDYYRKVDPVLPPAPERREWGYIPWTPGGTTMIRHRARYELGPVGEFLARQRPRHVYFSAGYYEDPGAGTMGEKGWTGSDLIFDLDADHLPGVNPDEDFGVEEPAIVFSGGRGYHVHVRDPSFRGLDREARREIVDYIRGVDVEFDALVRTEAVVGMGRKTPADKRTLDTTGGWGRRLHDHLVAVVNELIDADEATARDRLCEFDGIGAERADRILTAARNNYDEIASGNLDVHPDFVRFARVLFGEVRARERAAIDEPVTTDTHRLIRLPGSLHGGTALRVTPIEYEALDDFDPLDDAVPDPFTTEDIRVEFDGDPPRDLLADLGETLRDDAGITTLPEFAALFLMARGRAEKAK